MGTYASRRGPPDSPNVPDPFIFPEEERVIDLMDEIEERGDQARDEITSLVRQLCTRIAEQNNELEHRPAHETAGEHALTPRCPVHLTAHGHGDTRCARELHHTGSHICPASVSSNQCRWAWGRLDGIPQKGDVLETAARAVDGMSRDQLQALWDGPDQNGEGSQK